MASEYFKLKAKREIAEEAREEPANPPARQEKLQNWLHYHWLYLVIGAVLVWIAGSMLWNGLGIGQIKPDYRIAYVGRTALSEEEVVAVEAAFASLGTDVNGDGRILAALTQYGVNKTGDPETDMYYSYAGDTLLIADIEFGDSYFFLTDDPEGLQKAYQILANPDGTPPAETDFSVEGKAFPITDCPAFVSLAEYETLSGLSLGRRCFYGRAAEQQASNEELWKRITEGD